MISKHIVSALLFCASAVSPFEISAQQIFIEPLFEYPSAPDTLDGLQERSDYLMDHFWDSFDFSSKEAVDQTALNDAFNVYLTAMRYAERNKALASVNNIIKNLKGNSTLLYQFTKAAEEGLYGPRASIWSDEAYMPFLKAIVSDKNLSDTRKQRYAMQLDVIKRNTPGMKFPPVRLTLRNGRHSNFEVKSPLTLVEFGNPDCDDCKFSRMKLEMATDIAEQIENGDLGMYFIVADAVPEEQPEILSLMQELPEKWIAGICYGGDDTFDIRSTPSFYLLDKDGKILAKNLDVTEAVDRIRQMQATNKK